MYSLAIYSGLLSNSHGVGQSWTLSGWQIFRFPKQIPIWLEMWSTSHVSTVFDSYHIDQDMNIVDPKEEVVDA